MGVGAIYLLVVSALSQTVGHPASVTELFDVGGKTHKTMVSKSDLILFSLDSCIIIGLYIIYSNFIHIMSIILSVISIFLNMMNVTVEIRNSISYYVYFCF